MRLLRVVGRPRHDVAAQSEKGSRKNNRLVNSLLEPPAGIGKTECAINPFMDLPSFRATWSEHTFIGKIP
jgi:ATP-binding cassette subfamily B protein